VLQQIRPILRGGPACDLSGRSLEKRYGIMIARNGRDHIESNVLECSDVHEGQGICEEQRKHNSRMCDICFHL